MHSLFFFSLDLRVTKCFDCMLHLPQHLHNPTVLSYPAHTCPFFWTHQDQFVLPKYSWMCGFPAGTSPTYHRSNRFSLSQLLKIVNNSLFSGRILCPTLLTVLELVWIELATVLYMLSKLLCMRMCVYIVNLLLQKTLFHYSHLLTLTLIFFLSSPPLWHWDLEEAVVVHMFYKIVI